MTPEQMLYDFIRTETQGFKSVVEFGCGFGDKLNHVHEDVEHLIGVDAWQSYIDNNKATRPVEFICEDVLCMDEFPEAECLMIIDFLEHLAKHDAEELLSEAQLWFNKIILFLPIGVYEQAEDVTGYGAHYYQTHRHSWTVEEIEALGFRGRTVDFHTWRKAEGKDSMVYFGIWEVGQ